MADDSSSSSSSSHSSTSSSSSSSDDGNGHSEPNENNVTPNNSTTHTHQGSTYVDEDECKVFLSRIPQTFNDESIKRILEEKFGDGCIVDVSLVCPKEEEEQEENNETTAGEKAKEKKEHRGFGFVTFSSKNICEEAIKCGTVRGSAKVASKRRHTLYIQHVIREHEKEETVSDSNTSGSKDVCFLWKKFRCPYGDGCKFVHEGEGGCEEDVKDSKKTKLDKCFSFKKRGKCKLGDKCPFSHDLKDVKKKKKDGVTTTQMEKAVGDKSTKDCINWKTKGKCRKRDKCPYRHDESVRLKALSKKDKTSSHEPTLSKTKRKIQERQNKVKQSLSIRVFGLNYSTTQQDVHDFFSHCGKIMEITFPTYEDSGRSKGYCGILFASPKAVEKAVAEMNGCELHGRWLSVQEGKMFLRKWEEDERARRGGDEEGGKDGGSKLEEEPLIGEYGQKVKKRKKHGFSE